jgi:hypothetical protein
VFIEKQLRHSSGKQLMSFCFLDQGMGRRPGCKVCPGLEIQSCELYGIWFEFGVFGLFWS